MNEGGAELDMLFHVYDEYGGCYRWVVAPNPDAPNDGAIIKYQEFNKDSGQWDTHTSMCIGIEVASKLGEALTRLSGRHDK